MTSCTPRPQTRRTHLCPAWGRQSDRLGKLIRQRNAASLHWAFCLLSPPHFNLLSPLSLSLSLALCLSLSLPFPLSLPQRRLLHFRPVLSVFHALFPVNDSNIYNPQPSNHPAPSTSSLTSLCTCFSVFGASQVGVFSREGVGVPDAYVTWAPPDILCIPEVGF